MSEMQPEAVLATAAASEGHKPQLTTMGFFPWEIYIAVKIYIARKCNEFLGNLV